MRNRTCSIDGCEGCADVPGTARGWCQRHYNRWQRHGDPLGLLGRHGPQTATHKANISAALTGKKLSPEHIASITTHGLSRQPNYNRHRNMMGRCYNPSHKVYRYYGGRGITVHPDWHDVSVFCAWLDHNLGPCPPGYSLDRIDNDRDYEPGNVRWATRSEQGVNRRQLSKDRECVVCGDGFAAKRAHTKYCSTRCKGAAQRQRARR